MSELEKDSATSEEQHARLRQENLTLVHRANALEEQLKEQELHADETLNTLARKHRDALSKLQRERELEIENLQARWEISACASVYFKREKCELFYAF